MNQLVILRKFSPLSTCWENLKRNIRFPKTSLEELINKFNGFEGDIVSFTEVFDPQANVYEIFNQKAASIHAKSHLALFLDKNIDSDQNLLSHELQFIGYDYGLCEENSTNFSSIFNEVIFGKEPELLDFYSSLNSNLLFPNLCIVKRYVEIHHLLSTQGRDVEWEEYLQIYKIYKFTKLV